MNTVTSDLYGTMDPFQRATLSPKRRGPSNESNNDESNMFSYEYQVKLFHINFSSNNNKKTQLKLAILSSNDH
jgi:hypothetical protein